MTVQQNEQPINEVKEEKQIETKEVKTDKTTKFELDLSRQSKLIPKDKIDNWSVEVFGVGSVGSHVVECLAKSGFKSIKVYDMDVVAEENIAPQAFNIEHIEMKKVDAVKDIAKRASGITIQTSHEKITEKTPLILEPLTVYCCFFDSLEARRLIFDKVKGNPVVYVDGRIGKYDMRYYIVDCMDKDEVEEYETTLDTSVQSEQVCGEKACAPVNRVISGHIVMQMVNYISGKSYIKTFIGNLSMPTMDIAVIKEIRKPKELTASQIQEVQYEVENQVIADSTEENEEEEEDDEDAVPLEEEDDEG